jgi:hypothetical protein
MIRFKELLSRCRVSPGPGLLICSDGFCPLLLAQQQEFTAETQEAMLALLRTKGLSIKELDEKRRDELRGFMEYLHLTKGVSLSDIAKLIGNKTSGYTSWLCRQLGVQARPFEEARLKGIREKRRKYERRPFDGTDEDKAYLLALRHGDLSVSRPFGGVVRVSTSTTHRAMAELFHKLFEPYGHVYQDPRFKKDTNTYEWNLYTIVDTSFEFLFSPFSDLVDWILSKQTITRAYLAGLLDAEGSVGIHPAKKLTSVSAVYYNTNLGLMWFVHRAMSSLGYHPLEPYLDKEKGFRSPGYHIEMKKDYWRVLLARFEEAQAFLRGLPLRHREKIAKRDYAVTLSLGQPWDEVHPRVQAIRASIKLERDSFVAEAEKTYLANPRHQKGGRTPKVE